MSRNVTDHRMSNCDSHACWNQSGRRGGEINAGHGHFCPTSINTCRMIDAQKHGSIISDRVAGRHENSKLVPGRQMKAGR